MTADAPDLVTLLYRADWTRLSLAADVSVTRDRDLAELGSEAAEAEAGHEWEVATDLHGTEVTRSTLLVAPGGRYRYQGDGVLRGCDGDRSWRVDGDGDPVAESSRLRKPALSALLQPSWLLTGYTLEIREPVTLGGRQALRATATTRHGIRSASEAGSQPAKPEGRPAKPEGRPADLVEVVVDAELGILLRHTEIVDGQPLSVTELVSVTLNPADAADDTLFVPPAGWDGVPEEEPPWTGPSWGADKIATLVANALTRSHSPDSFRLATRERPEAAMPEQEPYAPGDSPVSGEILHLLHASESRWAPGIAATRHDWQDMSARLRGFPDYVRRVGPEAAHLPGGFARYLEVLGQRAPEVQLHSVSRLRLGGPGRYRIDYLKPAGEDISWTTACDGERCWKVFSEMVRVGPAAPLSGEIAVLFDASWLLAARLTGGTETTVDGRRGYRLAVAFDDPSRAVSPDEVVVDAEFGCLLRWISHSGSGSDSRVEVWYELRDVAAYASAAEDFQPDIPPGTRVVTEDDGPLGAWAGIPAVDFARQAVKETRSAVEGVLGFFRGDGQR